jgi:PKD repeat protein
MLILAWTMLIFLDVFCSSLGQGKGMFASFIRVFWVLCFVFAFSTVDAQSQSIHVEWGYTPPSQPQVSGFKLYQEGALVCRIDNPNANAMDCTVTLVKTPTNFTLTATFGDGTESPHSAPFAFAGAPSSSRDLAPVTVLPTALISSSAAAGTSPLTVSFDGTGSSAAAGLVLVSYLWDFGDGSSATARASATHIYNKPGAYTASLTVTDSKGGQNTVHTPVLVQAAPEKAGQAPGVSFATTASGALELSPKSMTNAQAAGVAGSLGMPFHMEAGELAVNTAWTKVRFATSYGHPIVVAGPLSFMDKAPCTVRIRNVAADGFEIRLAEWPYQDGVHKPELVSYLVMEQGRTTLNDGTIVEAGRFTGTTASQLVSFAGLFSQAPLVLTSVATVNEAEAVAGRVQSLGRSGFVFLFQEQQKNIRSGHRPEVIHYIAWEPGKGRLGGAAYTVVPSAELVSSAWKEVPLQGNLGQRPLLFSDMQTMSGMDPAVTSTAFQTKVQEEQSQDAEKAHLAERIGYLALFPVDEQRSATFSWEWYEDTQENLQGFRILANGAVLCATSQSSIRTLTCPLPAGQGQTVFAMEAIYSENTVSDPSNSIVYQP